MVIYDGDILIWICNIARVQSTIVIATIYYIARIQSTIVIAIIYFIVWLKFVLVGNTKYLYQMTIANYLKLRMDWQN